MNRRIERPGEVQLVLGLLLIILAVGFYFGQTVVGDVQDAELKAKGIVSEALVKAKLVQTESYTDRKGRPKTRTIHLLTVEHDMSASTLYADWKAKGSFAKSAYPAMTQSDFDVSSGDYDRIADGQKVTVIHLPSVFDSMELVSDFEYRTSRQFHLLLYLGVGLSLLAGLYFTFIGIRKRLVATRGQI